MPRPHCSQEALYPGIRSADRAHRASLQVSRFINLGKWNTVAALAIGRPARPR